MDCSRAICDDEEMGIVEVNHGSEHNFLGMTLDCRKRGKLTVDVVECIKKVMDFENSQTSTR